jgi:hypothetical protein
MSSQLRTTACMLSLAIAPATLAQAGATSTESTAVRTWTKPGVSLRAARAAP